MRNIVKMVTLTVLASIANPAFALAEDGSGKGLIGVGAGLAVGLAALGGAVGQGKAVSAGLDATGRNPAASGKLFTPMILGLVFMESLVILAFVIAFKLQGYSQ